MRITVDAETGATYIYLLKDIRVERTQSISDSVNADLDIDGRVVGIEILTLEGDGIWIETSDGHETWVKT